MFKNLLHMNGQAFENDVVKNMMSNIISDDTALNPPSTSSSGYESLNDESTIFLGVLNTKQSSIRRNTLGGDEIKQINFPEWKNTMSKTNDNFILPCSKCWKRVKLVNLRRHQNLHSALELMKFPSDNICLKDLQERRGELVKSLSERCNEDLPLPMEDLRKIDVAFDVIKVGITHEMEELEEAKPELVKDCVKIKGYSPRVGQPVVAFCQNSDESFRKNEERVSITNNFLGRQNCSFIALFGGYNGSYAAEVCEKHLHDILQTEYRNFTAGLKTTSTKINKADMKAILNNAFNKVDRLLMQGEKEISRMTWSGCSLVTCLITEDTLFSANLGNVRGLLVRAENKVKILTDEHNAYNLEEQGRLKMKNIDFSTNEKCSLVLGKSVPTRGLGCHGNKALKLVLSAESSFKCVQLKPTDKFILLASNALWECFTFQEVMYLINKFIQDKMERQKTQDLMKLNLENSSRSEKITRCQSDSSIYSPLTEKTLSDVKGYFCINASLPSITGQEPEKSYISLPDFMTPEQKSRRFAREISEHLVKCAVMKGCRDNLTVAIVVLSGFENPYFTRDSEVTISQKNFNQCDANAKTQ